MNEQNLNAVFQPDYPVLAIVQVRFFKLIGETCRHGASLSKDDGRLVILKNFKIYCYQRKREAMGGTTDSLLYLPALEEG